MRLPTIYLLLLAPILAGNHCPWHGDTEYVSADKYRVGCEYEYVTSSDVGLGTSSPPMITQDNIYLCSFGTPNHDSREFQCNANLRLVRDMVQPPRGIVQSIEVTSSNDVSTHSEDTCSLPDDQDLGVGVLTFPLVSGGTIGDMSLLNDESGVRLGQSDSSGFAGTISASDIQVSAKFLRWRSARTTGSGFVQLEIGRCERYEHCPVIMRYMEIALRDFNIVRPTILAKDVPIRKTRLYTLGNVAGRMDQNGYFELNGVTASIDGVMDGESIKYQSVLETPIRGRVQLYPDGTRFSSPLVTLAFNVQSDSVKIAAHLEIPSTRFLGRLRNARSGRCLRSKTVPTRKEIATIEDCSRPTQAHSWMFERNGQNIRIKNPLTNMCLNLRQSSQNREGGQVEHVNCSSHSDQKWRLIDDRHIQHVATGRCLNVHYGRENRNGGKVSVYSCASTSDQRWEIMLPG